MSILMYSTSEQPVADTNNEHHLIDRPSTLLPDHSESRDLHSGPLLEEVGVELLPSLLTEMIYRHPDQRIRDYNQAALRTTSQMVLTLIQAQEALARAHIDPVTGFPNQQVFEEEYPELFEQADNDKRKLALFYLDLNNLNLVNVLRGNAVGNSYLRTVADSLREIDGASRMYRLGGGGLMAVWSLEDERVAELIETRIRERATMAINNHSLLAGLPIGISLGAAVRGPEDRLESLLNRANNRCESDKTEFHEKLNVITDQDSLF